MLDGNAGDIVNSTGGWVDAGMVSFSGNTYAVYIYGSFTQMLIDLDVTRNIT